MTVVRWATTSFEEDIASTFDLLHQSLGVALAINFPECGSIEQSLSHTSPSKMKLEEEYRTLLSQLLTRSVKLNETYSQATFELRFGRIRRMSFFFLFIPLSNTHANLVKSIRPLIGTIEYLRRELAWGLLLKSPTPMSRRSPPPSRDPGAVGQSPIPLYAQDALTFTVRPVALSLGQSLLDAMDSIRITVLLAFDRIDPSIHTSHIRMPSKPIVPNPEGNQAWISSQLDLLHERERMLITVRDEARDLLKATFDNIPLDQIRQHHSKDVHHASLAMIALIQVSSVLFPCKPLIDDLMAILPDGAGSPERFTSRQIHD